MKPGDTILFHAAAGGVGLILGQWAKHLGATVIGTASSAEKIELARAHGFDHVINYRDRGFRRRGEGNHRRQAVRRRLRFGRQGHVSRLARLPEAVRACSQASASRRARSRRSIWRCWRRKARSMRPGRRLFVYNAKREALVASAAALFDVVSKGIVKIKINQRYRAEGCRSGACRPRSAKNHRNDNSSSLSFR